MAVMNPPSTRVRKRRAPQRQQLDPHQTLSVLRRRSSRVQSRLRAVSIPRILGSYYESQSPLEQRPTNPKTSQPAGATSYTCVAVSGPVEVLASAPLRAQSQEQARKRISDQSIKTSAERPPKRARLTKKNLTEFERMTERERKSAGKKSTGQPSSTATATDKDSGPQRHQRKSRPTDSETKSTRSKQTTSTTDSGFQDIVFQNGVLNPNCSKPPANIELIQERIDRSRETASPSESDYRCFAAAIRRAPNEASVLYETSVLLQRYNEPGYHKSYNQAFSNFPKNVGFNNDLSAAQPDMVEGLDLTQFDPFPAREQLGGAATVYAGPEATTLAHLAGEWKGPGKDMILAQTQAAYDGACMVYGRNQARSFLESPDPAGHAYVQTFTTDGTTLNTFAHYSSETQGQLKYHQFPTSSSLLISSHEDFKKSRQRLRNLQDNAKQTSENLRDELNKKWSKNQRLDEDEDEAYEDSYELVPPIASTGIPAETADFTNCNSYECNDVEDPTRQLLTEYWTSFSPKNQDESCVQIPAADSVHAPPYASFSTRNQDDPSMQISTTDNGYALPDALITPPQSSKTTSHPLKSSENIQDSNVRDHRRTRRTRTRAADPAESLRAVDHESNVRKTRKKR